MCNEVGRQDHFFKVGGVVKDQKLFSLYSCKLEELYPKAIPFILSNVEKFDLGKCYDVAGVKFFIVQDNIFDINNGFCNQLDKEINDKFIEIIDHTFMDTGGEVSGYYQQFKKDRILKEAKNA